MPSVADKLTDLQVQHAIYLLRAGNGISADVLKLLKDMEADISAKIGQRLATITERGHDIGPKTTERLNLMIEEVRSLIDPVYSKTHDQLKSALEKIAVNEGEFQKAALDKALPVKLGTRPPSPTRLKAIASERPIMGKLLEPMVKGIGDATKDRVEQQLRLGMAAGENSDKIIARVSGVEGLEKSKAAVRTIVRTSVNSVANQAQQETWKENAHLLDGWRFVATLDSRTTLICASHDGEVHPLGEGPIPPLHLNCRSTTIAVTKGSASLGGKKYTPAQRASIDGPVTNRTFDEWMRDQPQERQVAMMGKTRADLWRKGKLSLQDFIRNDNQIISLDELARLHPDAFDVAAGASAAAAKASSASTSATTTGSATPLDLDAIDAQERSYVLKKGEETGNEHLVAYDSRTGDTIIRKEGDRSSVSFSDPLIRALDDKASSIVLHHNHPGSSSLSLPDLHVLARPGAKAIWAHGHNGSSFFAQAGKLKLNDKTVRAISDALYRDLSQLISLGVVPVKDAELLHQHLVLLRLHELGQIVYKAQLAGSSAAAFERNKTLFERLLEKLR